MGESVSIESKSVSRQLFRLHRSLRTTQELYDHGGLRNTNSIFTLTPILSLFEGTSGCILFLDTHRMTSHAPSQLQRPAQFQGRKPTSYTVEDSDVNHTNLRNYFIFSPRYSERITLEYDTLIRRVW